MIQSQPMIKQSSIQYTKNNIQKSGLIPCKKQNCPNGIVIQCQNPQGLKSEYRCLNCDSKYCIICLGSDHTQQKCSLKRELENGSRKLFQCQNCMQTKQIQDKIGFCQCGFELCLKCYEEYLRKKVDLLQVPFCPSGCGRILRQSLKNYLDDESIKKYDKAMFNKIIKEDGLKVCKKNNCQNGIIIETLNQKREVEKQCPKCQTKYCKTCLQFVHPYKCNKIVLLQLIQKLGYRMCNSCENLIERNQGCNHMTCKCGYQFCYMCQQKYSQNHCCPSKSKSARQLRINKIKKQVQELQFGKPIVLLSQENMKKQKQIQKQIQKMKSKDCGCIFF